MNVGERVSDGACRRESIRRCMSEGECQTVHVGGRVSDGACRRESVYNIILTDGEGGSYIITTVRYEPKKTKSIRFVQ